MTDLRATIAPKSDQMNADDLIGGPKTIRVTKVSLCKEPDQPIAINYEGDDGKPYKPCKSMRRVMVNVWGPDGNAYAGRSMTLFRDDAVMFGGSAVGGIRISHMSNITQNVTMALTATRANRKPFTVAPLVEKSPKRTLGAYLAEKLAECRSIADIDALAAGDAIIVQNMQKQPVQDAIAQARARFIEADEPGDMSEADLAPTDEFPGDTIARENAA